LYDSQLASQASLYLAYTASPMTYHRALHDALPICGDRARWRRKSRKSTTCSTTTAGLWSLCAPAPRTAVSTTCARPTSRLRPRRSEEHTSELQSRENLVCRLLLEKKKATTYTI